MVKFLALSLVVLVNVLAASAPSALFAATPPPGMVDLVEGKPYAVTQLVSTAYSFAPKEAKYYKSGALTDGKIGSSARFNDGQWQGYDHGGSRSITVDLGRVNTIHQMQGRFIQDPDSAVYSPRVVTYALSMNGTDWTVVGRVNSKTPLTSKKVMTQTYCVSGLDYQARYVKMTFTVDDWVFADEFQAFGRAGVVDGATVPEPAPRQSYPEAYLPPGSPKVGGIRNMVLMYNGYYPADPTVGQNTVDELTPYVGYETPSGKITDFMFDGFLFLPFVAAGAPSGGMYYCDTAHPTVMSDWNYYLDNTFGSTYNLGALNIATGDVKKIMGDPLYKAKVEIAIPYPTPTATDFGDVNGDGVSENLSHLSDRERVIKWYIDQVISRWDSAGYKNLYLVGFYWYEEGADFNVDDSEAAMLSYAGNYVRSLGKVFDWIPAYQSSGFAEWDSLGFDGAVMQPNYVFDNFPKRELGEAADACRKLGMGVELEIHWDALTDSAYRSKYYAYLNYGITKGYMDDAVHMYYQNGGPGTFYQSCVSENPRVRELYDRTFEFIKGTYRPDAPAKLKKTE